MFVKLRNLRLEDGFLSLQALDSLIQSVTFLFSILVTHSTHALKNVKNKDTTSELILIIHRA